MKRKGFTLIELISVIVILGIIALIAVPTIMNIIGKSNKSAFKNSVYGIIRATELYYNEQAMMLEPIENDKEYIFPNIGELQIKGNIPSSGNMIISKEGDIAIAASNGKYCAKKGYQDTEVTVEEIKEECKTEEIANKVPITDIKLKGNLEIKVGDKEKIEVEYEPIEATIKELEWTSTDKSIATVNEEGEIKGIKSGVTTIIVKTTDGSNIRKEINVNVKQAVTKLEVNTSTLSLINGDTYQIITTIEPETAENKELNWTSSDNSIATVNSSGLITGIKGGTATITVSTTDGSNISKTVEVTVRQQVTNITLSSTNVTLEMGKTATVTATVSPEDAYMKGLRWTSSDPTIATISNGLITGIKGGSTTIKVESIDGSNIIKMINVRVISLLSTNINLSFPALSQKTKGTISVSGPNRNQTYDIEVAAGATSFEYNINLPERAQYSISVKLGSYEGYDSVESGNTLNLTLGRMNKLTVTIVDREGNRLSNARVELEYANTVLATGITDSNGMFIFQNVSNHIYNVVAIYNDQTSVSMVIINDSDISQQLVIPVGGNVEL